MKKILILCFCFIVVVGVNLFSNYYQQYIIDEIGKFDLISTDVYNQSTILRKDGLKAILKSIGVTDTAAIELENTDSPLKIYTDEGELWEEEIENHYRGYMLIGSTLIYGNELSFPDDIVAIRHNEPLTKGEALKYCVKCVKEDGMSGYGNFILAGLDTGLIDITDIGTYLNSDEAIKGTEFFKLLHKLLNKKGWIYYLTELYNDDYNYIDDLRNITYKEYLELNLMVQ